MTSIIPLIPCELNCFDHSAYDFFKKDEKHDEYIVGYRFKLQGRFEGPTVYAYMKKGFYTDGGIGLVINHEMVYSLGTNCYITGYYPIKIIDNNLQETNEKTEEELI